MLGLKESQDYVSQWVAISGSIASSRKERFPEVTKYLPVVAQTCSQMDSRKWKNREKQSICMYAT
jgi:hypothetical protein